MTKVCIICKKEFNKPPKYGSIQWKNRKYCSKKCYGKNNTGEINPSKRLSVRRKISESKVGNKNNMFGKRGESSSNWKGDKASYHSKHSWVRRFLGTPTKCQECGQDGLTGHKIHWANISGQYKRVKDDWKRLCTFCHVAFDKNYLKIKRDKESGKFLKN